MSAVNATVEFSTDGTTWTNISGSSNNVEPDAQTRMSGVAYTHFGDVGIVTTGKREPTSVSVTALYTETSGETFETLRPLFSALGGTRIYFRYSPLGVGASGRAVYTASNDNVSPGAVVITEFNWPKAEAESPDPVTVSFTLQVPAFIRTVTGNSTGLGTGA